MAQNENTRSNETQPTTRREEIIGDAAGDKQRTNDQSNLDQEMNPDKDRYENKGSSQRSGSDSNSEHK